MLAGSATQRSKRSIPRTHNLRNANKINVGRFGASESPVGASLGNNRDLASLTGNRNEQRRRYQLQRAARDLLPDNKGLHSCMRRVVFGAEHATIESNGERARLTGVHRCKQGAICPVCAPKIAMAHARELAAACAAAYAKGWRVIHVTYTLSHHQGDSLEGVLSCLSDARRKYFLGGRWYQGIKEQCQIQGSARALECTVGHNGWHPHYHELLFIAGDLPVNFEETLQARWVYSVQKVGGSASLENGLHLEEGSAAISEYLNKFGRLPMEGGHSVEMELSHGYKKIARKESKTPFTLLHEASVGVEKSGRLFAEYANAMVGRALIRWSKGLRELLEIQPEAKSDTDHDGDTFVALAALSRAALIEISDNALLPAVLTAAVAGYPVLVEFLAMYDINPHPRVAGLFVLGEVVDLHMEVWT